MVSFSINAHKLEDKIVVILNYIKGISMNNFKPKKDYSSIITFTLEEIDIILRSKFKAIKCDGDLTKIPIDSSFHINYLINDAFILQEILTPQEKEDRRIVIAETESMYANNEVDEVFLQDTYISNNQIIVVLNFNDDKKLVSTGMQCSHSQYIFEELIILQGNDYNYFYPDFEHKYPMDYQALQAKYFKLLKIHGYID